MNEETKSLEVEKSESSDKPAPSAPKKKTVEFVRPETNEDGTTKGKSSKLVAK